MKCKALFYQQWCWAFFAIMVVSGVSSAADETKKPSPAPAAQSEIIGLSFNGERHNFTLEGGHRAFVIYPSNAPAMAEDKRPWLWYAPTLVSQTLPGRELEWLFSRWLQAGYAIAGVDVGESYGNPAGRKIFTRFHAQVVEKFGLSSKACLLPQSRGGLMLYNWAVEHPQNVQCIGGIYTVCDLASYPGLDRAAPAYGMSLEELTAHLSEHNPIDRIAPLVKAKVPILHLHGDVDKLVPLERNAGELVKRCQALGGKAQLVIVPGKGHEVCPEFFQSQALLDFFLTHAGSPSNHLEGLIDHRSHLESDG